MTEKVPESAQDARGGDGSVRVDAGGERFAAVEPLVRKHRWDGGYFCGCGAEMNSPQTWSRHVLEDAWQHFTVIGVEAGRIAEHLGLEDR